jgi:hypothetical protein
VGIIANLAGAPSGSIPDWIEAIATVAAFAAAVFAARYAAGAFVLERERESQRLDAERRAQASLVAAWPARFIQYMDEQQADLPKGLDTIAGAEVLLRNASDLPVTNVHVDFWAVHAYADEHGPADIRRLGGQTLAVLPPATEPHRVLWSTEGRQHFLPGVPTVGDPRDFWPSEPPHDPARLILDLTFRDSSGVLWRRDRVGRLQEVLKDRSTTSD